MASDMFVAYALEHPEIVATVMLSVFTHKSTVTLPHNLLLIASALELLMLKDEGLRIVNQFAVGNAVEGRIYGGFADGITRGFVLSSGVEDISVLFSGLILLA